MSKKIGIIKTSCSNIKSISAAIDKQGYKYIVTSEAKQLSSCDKIIFPGVGNFGFVSNELKKFGLIELLKYHIENGKDFLGICLGMQMLFSRSEESKSANGLGVIKGEVKKLSKNNNFHYESFPNISWKSLEIKKPQDKIFNNISNEDLFYFIHSYYCEAINDDNILAKSNYNKFLFPSVIKTNNAYGLQFHPEKSKTIGLKIINNFCRI